MNKSEKSLRDLRGKVKQSSMFTLQEPQKKERKEQKI